MSERMRRAWLAGESVTVAELDRWAIGRARPRWAANVLKTCCAARGFDIESRPEFCLLVSVADDPGRWPEARDVFDALRAQTLVLEPGDDDLVVFGLAESAAKVVYNALDLPASFDADCGAVLIRRAAQVAGLLGPESDEARSIWFAVRPKPRPRS